MRAKFDQGDRVRLKPGARTVATFDRCRVCGRPFDGHHEAVAGPGTPPGLVAELVRGAEVCDPCWAWGVTIEGRARVRSRT